MWFKLFHKTFGKIKNDILPSLIKKIFDWNIKILCKLRQTIKSRFRSTCFPIRERSLTNSSFFCYLICSFIAFI